MYKGRFEAKTVAARAANKPETEQELTEDILLTPEPTELPAEEPVAETPVETPAEEPKKEKKEKKERKGPRTHTVVFYTLYVLFIVAFFVGFYFLLGELDGFLEKYEASQPDVKSAEVFGQLFADPDWGTIYDTAGMTGTEYDGKDSFVAFMDSKVGDTELTFVETSMGLSQDKKFLVRMGNENIAHFILTNSAGAVAIPEWELKSVEVYTAYEKDVTVHSYPGYTVMVNGVALGDDQVIRTTSTRAEDYLPDGLIGPRTVSYYLDGLMVAPTVTVTDEAGNEKVLTYDSTTNSYTHETVSTTISDEQTEFLENATRTYGAFMINDAGKNDLKKYFTGNSYDSITAAELMFVQDHKGHDFTKLEISEFYAYSDTYCSARIHRVLEVERKNGTIKEFDINTTFFMEQQSGKWMIVEMTNADVQAGKAEVRLRFMLDGQLLESQTLDSKTQMIEPPTVEVPEGKKLVWCIQTLDENGKKTLKPMYEVNEFQEILLPNGSELEPMDLHAVFIAETEE